MQRSTVVAVEGYRQDEATVTLECVTDNETDAVGWKYRDEADTDAGTRNTVLITLRFYNPTTFRFEFTANPDAGATDTLNEFNETSVTEPVDLTVEEDDGVLQIDTDALCVTVGLDIWSFKVTTPDGRTVYKEQRDDIDVHGDSRVDPLGYATEERNNGPDRVTKTGTSFAVHPDEHIYGFGEKFTELDKRGQHIESWHVEALGTETERSYKNVPFYLSTRGYGMLVDTTNRVEYDVGNTSTASGTVEVSDDTFAYVFFYGPSFKEIITEYTGLTGRATRPPKWSFGVWMSRLGYESREHLESITSRLREEEIPCDVVHLDPFWMREFHSCDLEWDTDQFPDPESMADGLHEDGFHLSLWEHPYVPTGTEAFETARENGYFVTDATGKPYVMDNLCQGDYAGAIVDFSNPEAADWWQEKNRRLVEMGVDVFKTDYGEGIPEDAVFANGRTGASMHNYYPFLYNQAVYEAVEDVNGTDDALIWGRSAWTGNQQFPMYWGGDAQPSFNGMYSALRGGLSVSLSGFPFWSHDIGGFRGEPSRETYIRWVQFGLLSSHSRCHGTTPREPWEFGDEAVEVFKKFAAVRYRLISYLYSYAEVACRTGLPIVRPLLLEYPDDPATYNLDTQYLLGEELLVAPVFTESGDVDVYLPEGEWVDFWSGERYAGGQTLHRTAALDEMPVFVRAGSILPLHESSQTVQKGSPEEVTLRVTPVETGETNASFDFYDEDEDQIVSLACTVDAASEAVTLSVEEATPSFIAEIVDIDHRPDTLSLNGELLKRVDTNPAKGEWTYDTAEGTVRAVL